MRKYGVLLLVLVLAVTSLLAAAAYNTANVTNAATLTVVSTDGALLALHAGASPHGEVVNGNEDATVKVIDHELVFNFGVGLNDMVWGLQPGSEYIWKNPFHIVNNSKETVKITLTATGPLANYIYFGSVLWSIYPHAFPHYNTSPVDEWHPGTVTYDNALIPGGEGNVNSVGMPAIRIVIPTGVDPATLIGTILVTGVAQ